MSSLENSSTAVYILPSPPPPPPETIGRQVRLRDYGIVWVERWKESVSMNKTVLFLAVSRIVGKLIHFFKLGDNYFNKSYVYATPRKYQKCTVLFLIQCDAHLSSQAMPQSVTCTILLTVSRVLVGNITCPLCAWVGRTLEAIQKKWGSTALIFISCNIYIKKANKINTYWFRFFVIIHTVHPGIKPVNQKYKIQTVNVIFT